ncbi:thermonuclease family protein [Ensifer sp.]|uniref:thermonuclease family protein n=1 Tax=Ensifer sp. TaxID=1872086 RepID=UPI002E13B06E|nr:thermonuclease family protein [Ensifer sp.]
MKTWIAGLAAALIALNVAAAHGPLIGRPSVIDGDTIETTCQRVRIHGVDAPESSQRCTDGRGAAYRCGREAARALDRFLAASRPTRCEPVDIDRYGRIVGACFRADGASVNHWLVANGYTLDWAKYSRGAYASDQDGARAKALGIWQGRFQLPCEARAERSRQKSSC